MTEFYHRGICRMCLSVVDEKMHLLTEEPDVIQKILACFSVRINFKDPFPKQICNECKEKIEDFHSYREKVTGINEVLAKCACSETSNALRDLYISLKTAAFRNKNEKYEPRIESDCIQSNQDLDFIEDDKCILSFDDKPDIEDEHSHSPVDNQTDVNQKKFTHKKFSPKQKKSKSPDCHIVTCEKIDDDENFITQVTSTATFKCLSCVEVCDSKHQLINHYKTQHKPIEKDVKSEYETITTSNGVVTYKCSICFKNLNNKKGIEKHVLVHAKRRSFLCKVCGRTYKTASDIVRHGRAHDGSRIYCSQNCGYSTAYLGALIQHEKRHVMAHKYKCEQCGKGFQVKTWYLQHQNIHKGLKPFVCDICGVAFHMDRYLTAHRSSVHPQTSEVKRYVCPHCSLPCDSRKAFTDHLKEHGISSSYLCDLCGKTLLHSEQLKLHKRMHLGVKPYSCSTCSKSFAKKFNLQLHMRTHSGEKAYSCSLCGKKYTQKSALLRHNRRQHSEIDQFKCAKCSKTFSSPNLLASHQNICM